MNNSSDSNDYDGQYKYNGKFCEISERSEKIVDYFTAAFFPFFCIVCFVGNFVNIKILQRWSQNGKWHVVNILLFSVSCSDMVGMVLHIPLYLAEHHSSFNISVVTEHGLPDYWGFFRSTSMAYSDLLLVGFTLLRLKPFISKEIRPILRPVAMSTRKKIKIIAAHVALLFVCMLLSFGRLSEVVSVAWYHAQTYLDIVVAIITMTAVAGLNLWLVQLTKRRHMDVLENASTLSEKESFSQRANSAMQAASRMAIGCILLYLVTQLPVTLLNITDVVIRDNNIEIDYVCRLIVERFVNTVTLVNYSCDFLVYIGMCKRFRQDVQVMASEWSGKFSTQDFSGACFKSFGNRSFFRRQTSSDPRRFTQSISTESAVSNNSEIPLL